MPEKFCNFHNTTYHVDLVYKLDQQIQTVPFATWAQFHYFLSIIGTTKHP